MQNAIFSIVYDKSGLCIFVVHLDKQGMALYDRRKILGYFALNRMNFISNINTSEDMTESKKNDRLDDKPRWELLPLNLLAHVVDVYTAGAKKYGPNQWQNLPDGYNRYKAALFRHLVAFESGEIRDPETGCLHMAQVVWNALAMLHFSLKK